MYFKCIIFFSFLKLLEALFVLSPFLLGWIMAMDFTMLISMRFISFSALFFFFLLVFACFLFCLNIYLHFSCLLFCSCSLIASVRSSQAAVWAC